MALGGVGVWIFLFRLNLPIPSYAVILPLSLIVGGTALSVQLVRSGWKPPAFGLALIVPLICAYATVVAAGFPVIDQARPTPEIARWLTHSEPRSKEPLALYRLERWKASLRFYSGRTVVTVENPEDLQRFLDAHPERWRRAQRARVVQPRHRGRPARHDVQDAARYWGPKVEVFAASAGAAFSSPSASRLNVVECGDLCGRQHDAPACCLTGSVRQSQSPCSLCAVVAGTHRRRRRPRRRFAGQIAALSEPDGLLRHRQPDLERAGRI